MSAAEPAAPLDRALASLDGLSVGDAFGFRVEMEPTRVRSRSLPPPVWRWSDDTHMALSVVEVLAASGSIDQDRLADAFARRFREDPRRGYGQGARRLLEKLQTTPWREASVALFSGGSYGNGAAMRVGPLGAFFAGDPREAASQGARQAEVTHAHPEGVAGAIAVAVAASIVASDRRIAGAALLSAVLDHVPKGDARDGLESALAIPAAEVERAAKTLGAGRQISAQDTVPFCLWCASHRLDSYEEALWTAISVAEDSDTVCAIVGSVVALRNPPPPAWVEAREPLGEAESRSA